MSSVVSNGQHIDLNNVKSLVKAKPIQLNGGISANSILYSGNAGAGRQPLTYFINGFVNFKLFQFVDLPFSFNLTNAGGGFNYPTLPNRFSVRPTYKWVTAHIGGVNMSFSPYTLNGHEFTGIGLDVVPPKGKIKVSAMYGRLQRAVEYDTANVIVQSAYKRMGYGARIDYTSKSYSLALTAFAAKDRISSINSKPADSLHIFPQKNLAVSLISTYKFSKGLALSAEYALSALTRDIRDSTHSKSENNNLLKGVINENNSTSFYKALKAQLNYTLLRSTIGIGYERIDPGYETLGAYFFSNDLENITINFAQVLMKEKANLFLNFGLQRDNLDSKKSGTNKRTIVSLNFNYTPNKRLYLNASYSNFQTFMNIKPQFQYINQLTQFQNMDTLNFSQISQNANFNLNYILGRKKAKQSSINVNLSFLDAADKQGGIIRKGNVSDFYNAAVAYSLLLDSQRISITTAFNASYNTIGRNDFMTLGPTLAVNVKLFKKKVTAGFSTSYNSSTSSGTWQSKVLNIRCHASYIFKKRQNLNFTLLNQSRNVKGRGKMNDLVGTLGYNFSF